MKYTEEELNEWKRIQETYFPNLNMDGHWDRFMEHGAKKKPDFKKCSSGVAMHIRHDNGTDEWVSLGELMRSGAYATSYTGFSGK